jgi:signal transduction histidine kinase
MLAVALALFITQGVSAFLLYKSTEQRRETALINAAAFQLIAGPRATDRSPRLSRREVRPPPLRILRQIRYAESVSSPLLPGERRFGGREERLSKVLAAQGITASDIAITARPMTADPLIMEALAERPRLQARLNEMPRKILVAGIQREGRSTWEVVRVPIRPAPAGNTQRLIAQSLLLFAVLMGVLFWALRRITRPLAMLRQRTESFARTGSASEPLTVQGPRDVADLTNAHNRMEARITAMLDEKDFMLGAIGHDLKTPLSALRVRIETVEDAGHRAKMAGSIDDITRTLDEILDLARIGRSDSAPEMAELRALTASLVEEFQDTDHDVELLRSERLALPIHITWIKRGVRNLISNAVRYAGSAKVSVQREDGSAIIRVEDDGPGIDEDKIVSLIEPFARGEASRNRATGGAGLGLTIARAVAEQHGGKLVLSNRAEGGLNAEIRIPIT